MESDPELDPDPLVRYTDPHIRIRTKMSRIPNSALSVLILSTKLILAISTWRNLENNALSSLHKLLRNRPGGTGLVGWVQQPFPPPPTHTNSLAGVRNNQSKDDSVLFSRLLHVDIANNIFLYKIRTDTAVLRIRDILLQIWIQGSVPLTIGSDSFFSDFKDAKKNLSIFFLIAYPQAHYL